LSVFCCVCYGAGCHGAPTFGKTNNYPIQAGQSHSRLISRNPHGKLYSTTVINDGGNTVSNYSVLHLYGTPREMGLAQGLLLKSTLKNFLPTVWTYLEAQVSRALPNYFPQWFSELIAIVGLDAALDFTEYVSAPYTGEHFFEELQGIADASGVDYALLLKIHMIAGLTQGDCSMFGAWGSALNQSGPNPTQLLQMRALDWNMQGPFRDFAQLTVYHPAPGYGHAFANIGFSGFIGGLSGVSSTQLGISEIGVAFPDKTFGDESRWGVPFIFLLRDILQFDDTFDDAINRMVNSRRTCDLILGVGDGKLNEFRGFEYSYSVLNVFDDTNMMPYNQTWHPRIKDTVYWGMDWICPGYNYILAQQLNKYHGKLTAAIAIANVPSIVKTGDNHIAFYDLTNMQLYLSFAAPHNVKGHVDGYNRQFTQWDLHQLFSEPAL